MLNRALSATLFALVLSGCASTPVAVSSSLPWLDREFDYQPALVTVAPDDIFRLDPELARKLADPATLSAPMGQRLKRLLGAIFGADGHGFAYRSGHSTVAAETWATRSGDCLSLTVLTYSVSRVMGMSAQMQEVQTPAIFGRVGELDIVNQHVNVLFPHVRGDIFVESEAHDVVIDFEPDFRAPRRGTPLQEAGIVARYYNNVAVENMAQGKPAVAYAYFKAAILKDPAYASPYGNLAVLYRRSGHEAQAEHLLKYAVSLEGSGEVALHELHRLYVDQGRVAEAREVDRRLEARRESDPYYWMGLGLKHLAANEPKRAVDALKHAVEIAPSFSEVHRYLAVAYARSGDSRHANEELAALTGMGAPANKLAMLRRKLEQPAQ
jgi:tetratricopeptide (TPR) repeat protein